jgi:Flp pilus assembly protein TadD
MPVPTWSTPEPFLTRGSTSIAIHRQSWALDTRNLVCYADLLNKLGRPGANKVLERAVAEARAATSARPDDPLAHRSFGLALRIAGNLQDAVTELREAARLEPDDPGTDANLADALFVPARRAAEARLR